MNDAVNLEVDFLFNTPEALADAKRIENGVANIGNSAAEASAKVNQSLKSISQSQFNLQSKLEEAKNASFTEKSRNKLVEYNKIIQTTEAEISRLKNVGKAGFDELGNAVGKSTNVAGKAFSGLKLIANILPGIGIAGLLGFAVGPIMEYLSKLDLFKTKITDAKLGQENMAKALAGSDYAKAVTNVNELNINIDLAKKGFLSKEAVLKQYNETIGKTTGQVSSLDQAEQALVKNANAFIQMTLLKAAAQIALEESAKKAYEAEISRRKKLEEFGNQFLDASVTNIRSEDQYKSAQANIIANRKRRQAEEVKISEDSAKQQLSIAKKFEEDAAKIAKANGFNFFGNTKVDVPKKTNDGSKSILTDQENLQERIQAIKDKFARKALDKNEEAKRAIIDEFKVLVTEIEKQAIVYDDFVKKYGQAKADGLGLKRPDATTIEPIRKAAIDNLTYEQDTAKLALKLENDKNLYADFEAYKTKFGIEKAKERFKGQIDVEKTYLQQLQAEYALTAKDAKTSGSAKERLNDLQKLIDAEKKAEEKRNDDILKDFQTYAEERARIQEKYLTIAQGLRAQGENDQAQLAINKGVEEVEALDKTNLEKWVSYQKLFNNIGKISRTQTLDAIKEYEKELLAFNGSAKLKAKKIAELKELKKAIKDDDGKALDNVISKLSIIANEFGNINGNVGNIANVLLNSAKAYLDIKTGIDNIQDPKKSTTEKIGAGLGIVGAAMGVASTVIGYFKGLKAAKEAAKKAMDDYQSAAIKGELDYQSLLRKRENDEVRRGKNSYKAIVDQLELLKKQSPEIQAAYDRIFASLQGQSSVSGVGYQHGTWLRKAKTWDIMATLAGSQYADLEKLYLKGQLKDQAKADFESLKALVEELKQAGYSVEDLQAQLTELLTGTTAGGLADGLTQLFENLKFGAADFGQSFEQIMRNALISSFKVKFLQDQMQPFLNELGELMKAGIPSQQQVEDLRKKFIALGSQGADMWKFFEQTTGISLAAPATVDNPSALTGGIRGAQTEETGNKIEGISRAQYEIQKQTYVIHNNGLEIMKQQLMINERTAVATENTVLKLDDALKVLADIKDNTAPKLIPR